MSIAPAGFKKSPFTGRYSNNGFGSPKVSKVKKLVLNRYVYIYLVEQSNQHENKIQIPISAKYQLYWDCLYIVCVFNSVTFKKIRNHHKQIGCPWDHQIN
jgi:hypothetical protein